ncbi:MAG TPA: hypothetical protein EYO33_32705 [Phycisphaerales bacterium]|nr:hypothetical protein [Phycisphaerales bacterium]
MPRTRTGSMAKSDSFFVRSQVTATSGAFTETEIDLGAFVDVQDKTILRVHNIAVQYTDSTGIIVDITASTATNAAVRWQLNTQSQTALVTADDRSVVSTGSFVLYNNNSATQNGANAINETLDMSPQDWTGGYLIAVESLFLGGERDANFASGDVDVTIVMECSTETMGVNQAMALAMSQQ